jgi:flagellar hook-length control protein FliK
MRLRLDPPQLGELDLHLVVEKGSTLRLLVVTERQELRDLLLGGLGELRQKLQEGGLTVAHAEVQTRQEARDRGLYQRGADGQRHDSPGDEAAAKAAPARPTNTGWFTAHGLDFWV